MEQAVIYLKIIFAAVFVQNFVLSKFLGLCPFIGVSKKRSSAIGMGLAVIFVMTLASAATMLIYQYLLKPFKMEFYLDIVSFIVVIAALVQFVELAMRKLAPALYKALGIYLPLITTNCAVLGVTQLNLEFAKLNGITLTDCLLRSIVNGVFAGVGFTLALVLMAGIRERLESSPVPECMQGVPIAFIAAACMALAFFGFAGIA
ncbi:MAG: RnfABCDGE type electron transport complex subunit A [Planctomycetes bacterium]|nr:RnfABCDGE type electron transport complex subunit A [Planctomycetota bacterium]